MYSCVRLPTLISYSESSVSVTFRTSSKVGSLSVVFIPAVETHVAWLFDPRYDHSCVPAQSELRRTRFECRAINVS